MPMEVQRESEGIAPTICKLVLDGDGWSTAPSDKRPANNSTGDDCALGPVQTARKISPQPEFHPATTNP